MFSRSCTTLDHVYPVHATATAVTPGTSCYCGQRRWPDSGRSLVDTGGRVVESVGGRPVWMKSPTLQVPAGTEIKLAPIPQHTPPADRRPESPSAPLATPSGSASLPAEDLS